MRSRAALLGYWLSRPPAVAALTIICLRFPYRRARFTQGGAGACQDTGITPVTPAGLEKERTRRAGRDLVVLLESVIGSSSKTRPHRHRPTESNPQGAGQYDWPSGHTTSEEEGCAMSDGTIASWCIRIACCFSCDRPGEIAAGIACACPLARVVCEASRIPMHR